jgi:MFS family permease
LLNYTLPSIRDSLNFTEAMIFRLRFCQVYYYDWMEIKGLSWQNRAGVYYIHSEEAKAIIHFTPNGAGLFTAGFVILATAIRPIGGWLADRFGGRTVLLIVFPAIGALSLLLTQTDLIPFTIGALGTAAVMGLGNGAVFKLVPEHFPNLIGTITGKVNLS